MLSHVCSTQLRSVVLELNPRDVKNLLRLQLSRFNDIFASPAFANARLVLSFVADAYEKFVTNPKKQRPHETPPAVALLHAELSSLYKQNRVDMDVHEWE